MPKIVLLFALTMALTADGATVQRHYSAVRAFRVATGYPRGRPGFVVDHRIPLCAGGRDVADNLQWQALAASYKKDAFERQLCAEMKRQSMRLVAR